MLELEYLENIIYLFELSAITFRTEQCSIAFLNAKCL